MRVATPQGRLRETPLRARRTGALDCVALLGNGTTIARETRLARTPVRHAEAWILNQSLPRTLLSLLLILPMAAAAQPAELVFDDARVRALIPGQDKTAGYFEAENRSDRDILLVGVESPAARAAEFHTVIRDGDMMRMRRLEQVVIPAGERIRFAPGGNHLMLFGVVSLEDQTEFIFITESGDRFRVSFRLIPVGAVQ